MKSNKFKATSLIIYFILLAQSGFSQIGSNEYHYMYFYEFKDSAKNISDVIDIGNTLSRKFKYYYIFSKELGIKSDFQMRLKIDYTDMKAAIEKPLEFNKDSINLQEIENCFSSIQDPFLINIHKPTLETHNILKVDTIKINRITIQTNQEFIRSNNYELQGIAFKDSRDSNHVFLKGFFQNNQLVLLNGFFFFDNINNIVEEQLIDASHNSMNKQTFKTILGQYERILKLRNINYQLISKHHQLWVVFPQYQMEAELTPKNILTKMGHLVTGGNVYQTLIRQ